MTREYDAEAGRRLLNDDDFARQPPLSAVREPARPLVVTPPSFHYFRGRGQFPGKDEGWRRSTRHFCAAPTRQSRKRIGSMAELESWPRSSARSEKAAPLTRRPSARGAIGLHAAGHWIYPRPLLTDTLLDRLRADRLTRHLPRLLRPRLS